MYKLKIEQGYNTLRMEFKTGEEAIAFIDAVKDHVSKNTSFYLTVQVENEESEEDE